MAIINQATKELQVKIVYYGPAMGGKTTNLVQVHDHVQTTAGNKGKLVLRGVDGIVFVADSQYEKMAENVESFNNLEENLRTLKLNMADIPYVLQYNKQDLPNVAPVDYMEFLLNNRELQVPSFTSTAHKCEGVFESLNMITRMLLNKFISQTAPQPA